MIEQSGQKRVRGIYHKLLEMATGNLDFRIVDRHDDNLSIINMTLKDICQKMEKEIREPGCILPYYNDQDTVHFVLLLDLESNIISAGKPVIERLEMNEDALMHTNFNDLLKDGEKKKWHAIVARISENAECQNNIFFNIETPSGEIIPLLGNVVRLSPLPFILLNSTVEVPRDVTQDIPKKEDAKLVKQIYDFIMANLETPLPSLHKLSLKFNTNEFRLKEVFRQHFKISIFQFYNEERLKRAHKLIQQTAFSLKTIAIMSGFNDYANFAKAFKKKFGYKPGDVNRNAFK